MTIAASSNDYWPSRSSLSSPSKSANSGTTANFGSLLQSLDTVELSTAGDSPTGSVTTAGSVPADQESQSASDARVKELIGKGYDQRTATVIARDWNNPAVITPEYALTSSDKQMLQQLAGTGRWQDQSSLFKLSGEIATDRLSGKLKGNLSAAYIQGIKDGQAVGNAKIREPDAVLPTSVLDAALAYIKAHPSKLNAEIVNPAFLKNVSSESSFDSHY